MALSASAAVACGGEKIVEKVVVETVIVEKQVAGETVKVVETVIVDRPVTRIEKVVETVVIEKRVTVEVTAMPAETVFPIPHRGDVAREDTMIQPGSGEPEIVGFDNQNPYSIGGLGRVRGILAKTVYEMLFLYNHNSGKEIPWLAESFQYNADFTKIDVTLRDGIEWADGMPFTSDDVKFTLELLRDNEELVFSEAMAEWVKDVTVKDDRNFTINLNKPNSRFFYFFFVENSEIHITILPKHVWEGEDALEFTNFDLDKGFPLGTGPYGLIQASPQGLHFDRNDDWWGAKVGFKDLPKPLRLSSIPIGGAGGAVAACINNVIDVCGAIQPGEFVAAKKRNPSVISWNTQGPRWGAADACLYTLGLNTAKPPFDSVDVRWAINHAIDRAKFVEQAYENATVVRTVPFSTFGGLEAFETKAADVLAKYNIDDPDQAKVEARMQAAGYAMDSDGYWAKGGDRLKTTLYVAGWLDPQGPVLEKQLRDAGFDITAKLDDPTYFDLVRTGEADIWAIVHCGSSKEPHGTLQHYHSKFASPIGEMNQYLWANSNYDNPQYDALIEEMDGMIPTIDDPRYVELVNEALDIFARDMVEITTAEERHVWTYNSHYWSGFPSSANPFVAPYHIWGDWFMTVLNLEKTQ